MQTRYLQFVLDQLQRESIVSIKTLNYNYRKARIVPLSELRKKTDATLSVGMNYTLNKLMRSGVVCKVRQGMYSHTLRMPSAREIATYHDPMTEKLLGYLERRHPRPADAQRLIYSALGPRDAYALAARKLRELKADGLVKKEGHKWLLVEAPADYEPYTPLAPEPAPEPIDIFS